MADSVTSSGGQTFSPGMMSGAYQKAKDNGLIIFFIAIGIYILDYVYTKFNSLEAATFFTTTGLSLSKNILLYGILLNSIFWIFFIFFYFIKKPENPRELISFFVLLSSIFFILGLVGIIGYKGSFNLNYSNLGVFIHILFIVFGIRNGLLLGSRDKAESNYITAVIIFIDMFLFSIIYNIFHIDNTLLNQVIVPILPIVTLILMGESKARSWLLFLILTFYVLVLLQTYGQSSMISQNKLTDAQKEGAKAQAVSAWDKLWNGITKWKNQSDQMISGDYYTGQVEQAQTEKLGVFLEDIKASDQNFLINESVEVWAKMKAYKLKDMNEAITINVTCYATKGQKTINGTISPKPTFSIDSYEEEFLTCKFPDKTLSNESGYYTVTFNATFNFNTQSYLRTYYMEKERKRTLVSQGINILSQYGITDTNPVAKYTNGPVMMGMETTSSLPIGVPTETNSDQNYEFSSYIGITFDNSWKGTIKKINWLTITLPEGLAFEEGTCEAFQVYSGKNVDPKRNAYELTSKQLEKDNKGIKFPKSYKCALLLLEPSNLLGTSPLSIKTFYVSTSYIYQISESTGVTIKNS